MQVFERESDELVHIVVNGERITTTPEHPFYRPTAGWTSAADLRAGDRLALLSGKVVVVEEVQHEILEKPITVYNFEVEDFHTYFVGYASILVHNTCSAILPPNGSRMRTSDALNLAENYLGPGYTEASLGRFVSADGLRQIRMGTDDLLGLHGGGPHINFDSLSPKYKTVHLYYLD